MKNADSGLAVVAVVLLVVALISLLLAARHGRAMKETAQGEARQALLRLHKTHLHGFFVCLFLAVVAVELLVQMNAGRWGSPWLFWLHMGVITTMTIYFLLTYFVYNGVGQPTYHKGFAWRAIILFVLALVTGGILFSQHPLFR